MRGDLDRIAAKALRKEAARRYSSAEQLTDDVRRHLDGLPIRARPDTALYLLNKFVHRNHALSLAMVLLLVFALAMAWQGVELRRKRDEFEQQRQVAEKVTDHIVDLVKNWDPLLAQGNEPTIGEALERGALTLDSLAGQPTVHARLRNVYGEILMNRGKYAEADRHLQQALEIELQLGNALDIADSQNRLGALRSEQGRYEEASELMQLALAGFRQALGDRDERVARMLSNLGALHFTAGDLVTAEPLIREALTLQVDLLEVGETAQAADLFEEALRLRRRVLPSGHPRLATSLLGLGRTWLERGQAEQAEPLFREAVEIRRATLETEGWRTASAECLLGLALMRLGNTVWDVVIDIDRFSDIAVDLSHARPLATTEVDRGSFGHRFKTVRQPSEA